jgi:site-specific recombinase XerD
LAKISERGFPSSRKHSNIIPRVVKRHLRLVSPATINRTVAPRRPPNGHLRTREYLTEAVFTSERSAPFSPAGFARMIERTGIEAKLGFKAHPHMLRHACGYKLANDGHDTRALQAYLGHKNIQHTVRYTELAPTRFKDFWRA